MLCQICYTPLEQSNTIKLPCDCISCSDCLTSWILTQTKELYFLTNQELPCITSTCKRRFKVEEIFDKLETVQQNELNTALFDVYLKKTDDISKCPNTNCSYAGVIDNSMFCQDKVECGACDTKWREHSHYNVTEKVKDFIWNRGMKRNEVLSGFWQEIFTRRCPNCSVSIQKNGGCNHMTCEKCKHEFCWLCDQKHRGHNLKTCRFAFLIKASLLILSFANLLCLTSMVDVLFQLLSWTFRLLMGGVAFNLWALTLGALVHLFQTKKSVYTPNGVKRIPRRESNMAYYWLGAALIGLMGIIKFFDMYFTVGVVACVELILAGLFKHKLKKLRTKLTRLGAMIRYIKRNKTIIYVYIKSYLFR